MKLIAVTACPTGVAHTFMAAEALKRQAEVLGHEISVETQGAQGAGDVLEPTTIGDADAVVVAADVHVDMARFSGLPMVATSTSDAIRNTAAVIARAITAAAPEAPVEPVTADPATPNAALRLVAITSCPTGIAHTFMAAEGLQRAAEGLGHVIKVETQGSVGAKNVLTGADVAAADAVIIAADTKVDLSRFAGKRIYETGTKEALKHGDEVIAKALASTTVSDGGGAAPPTGTSSDGDEPAGARAAVKQVYQHLMTGVSYMLPFVVAGGLMIAISFAVNINANDPDLAHDVRRPALHDRRRRAHAVPPRVRRIHQLLDRGPPRSRARLSSAGTWRRRSVQGSSAPCWRASSLAT